jgi:hypothetical protein
MLIRQEAGRAVLLQLGAVRERHADRSLGYRQVLRESARDRRILIGGTSLDREHHSRRAPLAVELEQDVP